MPTSTMPCHLYGQGPRPETFRKIHTALTDRTHSLFHTIETHRIHRTPLDFPRTSRASPKPPHLLPRVPEFQITSTHLPAPITGPQPPTSPSSTHHRPSATLSPPTHPHESTCTAQAPESHREGEKNPNSLWRPIFLKRRIKRGGRGRTPFGASPNHHEVACTLLLPPDPPPPASLPSLPL